ncbi:MAG: TetR/AcrR family transcriptional regulator [Blastocatellales bacterium]|nr:TetR/AcrR family transcriptional regulator [Nitrosomonas nitrosa]
MTESVSYFSEIMARTHSTDLLERLLQASMRVFAQKGLSRARMSDVAAEMGVAQGSLYNYVESKEALFYLLVDQGGRQEPATLPARLPLRTPTRKQLLKRIEEQIENTFVLAKLDTALKRRQVADVGAELEEIVRELYQRIYDTREPATVLERSAIDQPDLFILFFVRTRRQLLERLTRYIKQRSGSGHFQPVRDPAVAARYLLETVTFFARHRYSDPDLQPGDDETVRETVVQLIVRSFIQVKLPTRPRGGRTRP